ncbi:MAG: hypothetical protein QM724_11395 [Flavobacteriales bacterium]
MSSTVPIMLCEPDPAWSMSPTRKGLNATMKMPLMMSLKAFCAAKPMMATSRPAPANRVKANERSDGIVYMMAQTAPIVTTVRTALRKKR